MKILIQTMLKNYFKIARRNLIKNKVSSFINIGGLAIGMSVAILISLWIWDELSFNKYHKNSERIAQVMQHQNFNNEIHSDKALPFPLADALRNTYGSDFKYIALSSWTNPHVLSFNGKNLSKLGNFMEPDAPYMLTLKMLKGSREGLKDPYSILLSETVSKAMFGDTDPIGQILKLDTTNVKVTGIYEELPYNSNFSNLYFIASWALYSSTEEIKNAKDDWNNNSFQLFAEISDSRKMLEISDKIKDIKLKNIGEEGTNLKPEIFLHPMTRWHLYPEFKNGVNTGGQVQYLWMFGIIGVFVLLLACINFMNLSTARSEKRAKEVGIRKAVGSLRGQLIGQFFSESLLVAFVAFAFSLLLVQLILPFFNEVADKKMTILWSNPLFWLMGIGFSFITGLIAGSYPALYLSSFQTVKALKGTFRVGRFAAIPRKVLVVLQFTISVILIIGTMIVFRQIQFAKNRPLGYGANGLVIIRPYSSDFHDHFEALRNDLLQTGMITEVAESGNSITRGSRTSGGFEWKGKAPNMQDEFTTVGVSTEYGKTVGWQFTSGRDFSKASSADSSGLILNEAAVKYMGLKNPVGETITWGKKYTILGVIKNIVMQSPYESVKQAVYYITPEAGYLNIKINPNSSTSEALNEIETICKQYSPATPFEYKFADEEYSKKFGDEERIKKLSGSFAILAIFISCLGLFGMASFMAEQRIKEIGVRKVLGASVFNLWRLLSKDFVLLVLLSCAIAIPAAYYFLHQWLQNYEYRTEISWWIFAAAGIGALVITLLTVSFQAIKAAIANPVKSLRTE
jgi:putative ABC transport system permease protein